MNGRHAIDWLLWLSVAGLLLIAILQRCLWLDNLPGLNGDEAWYGVQAISIGAGESAEWRTPTGNPLNPLFMGPLVALHRSFPPSATLLRLVSLLSGLLALLINFALCRWVFDKATAWVSTVILAVLPINIAYSRFAWDASQSVLITLPVVYLSLAQCRLALRERVRTFAERKATMARGALLVLLLGIAALVHPTNLPIAAVPLAVLALALQPLTDRLSARLRMALGIGLVGALLLSALSLANVGGLLGDRLAGPRELAAGNGLVWFVVLLPRLFVGTTVYEYITGHAGWLAWPATSARGGLGFDVVFGWIAIIAAGWFVWRNTRTPSHDVPNGGARLTPRPTLRAARAPEILAACDRALLGGVGLLLVTMLVFFGPAALTPGYERYGMVCIAPVALLLARGLVRALESLDRPRRQWLLVLATLVGWCMVLEFAGQYLLRPQIHGGCGHLTFRTNAIEPKLAVAEWIAGRVPRPRWIKQPELDVPLTVMTSEYWLYWPLRYYLADEPRITIVLQPPGASQQATDSRHISVEFCDEQWRTLAADEVAELFYDAGGVPIIIARWKRSTAEP